MKTLKLNSRVLSMAVASILAVGVGAFSANSYADTNTATLPVSANIDATCEVSTSPVLFGTYDPVGTNALTPLDNSGGKVTMTCTTGAIPKVALNLGLHAAASQRKMIGGAGGIDLLNYQLYQPADFSTVWGSEIGVDTVIGATGDGLSNDLVINARIPAGQNTVSTGAYADTVTVSVTF